MGFVHSKLQITLSDYKKGDTALHSAAPPNAQSSYDCERLACSSKVVGLSNNEGSSTKVGYWLKRKK